MQVAVIGAGHVGLVTAACLAHIGHDVVVDDDDAAKLDLFREGRRGSTSRASRSCWATYPGGPAPDRRRQGRGRRPRRP